MKMECTQRIECTQPLYGTQTEKSCPEQVGYLGICGVKYPVYKGPNKLGRDPQTCQIVIDLNSISRQHAVINIMNKKDFMLMDLGSSNRTKVMDVTLQPYIPYPLKDGDTVQFGQVFGIFRLLEEDDELPMTQVIDVPETPVNIRHMSRVIHAPITTIPESPDVSDKDDSFIVLSQPQKQVAFKSPSNQYIKGTGTTIAIRPVGTNKIDNIYWTSSKKSDSFSNQFADNSKCSINNNSITNKNTSMSQNNIHDLETQAPFAEEPRKSLSSLYDAETQIPDSRLAPSIHSLETQPPNFEKLPVIRKIQNQDNVTLNLYSTVQNIFDMQTQISLPDLEQNKRLSPILQTKQSTENKITICNAPSSLNNKSNTSDDEICYDEIDDQQFDDFCGSQPLLPANPLELAKLLNPEINQESENCIAPRQKEITKTHALQEPDNSNDSEDVDIPLSQRIPENLNDDDSSTDCDEFMELAAKNKPKPAKAPSYNDATNKQNVTDDINIPKCDDDFIELNKSNFVNSGNKLINVDDIEDLPTQIIGEQLMKDDDKQKPDENIEFEDMPTQIIEECPVSRDVNTVMIRDFVPFEELETQVLDTGIPDEPQCLPNSAPVGHVSPFKVPCISPVRLKKKDLPDTNQPNSTNITKEKKCLNHDNENYYAATQEIFEDLCTQTKIAEPSKAEFILVRDKSSEASDGDEKVKSFVSNLSKQQIREVIGADVATAPIIKKSSDSSDLESTPTKTSFKWSNVDLPDTPQIMKSKFVRSIQERDSSSCSSDSEELGYKAALSYLKNNKQTKVIKKNLSNKFNIAALPARVMTRIRKPTSKILDGDKTTKISPDVVPKNKTKLDSEHKIDPEKHRRTATKPKSRRNSDKDDRNDKSKNVVQNIYVKNEKEIKLKIDKINSKEQKPVINEKQLKQQNIKSMLNESKPKDLRTDVTAEVKTEQNDAPRVSRSTRRGGAKYNTNKKENNTVESKAKREKSESSDRKKSSNRKRSSRKEEAETLPEITQSVRRSKRQRTSKETKDKDEANVKDVSREMKVKEDIGIKENISSKGIQDKDDEYGKEKRPLKKTKDEVYVKEKKPSKETKGKKETIGNEKKTSKETKEKRDVNLKEKRSPEETNDKKETNGKEKMTLKETKNNKEIIGKEKKTSKEAKEKEDTKVNDKFVKEQKEKKEKVQNKSRTNKSTNHEQSTVYNVSTESGVDSPARKRPASDDVTLPLSKRPRSTTASNMSLRAMPRDNRKHRVLFTAFPNEEVKAKLEQLGAEIVSDVRACTVVLTLRFKRTFKLLCAVGLGKPIVGPNWVQACADTNMIVDPWQYLLKDEESERRYNFNLRKTLCGKRGVFKGHTFSCTTGISPKPQEMKLIVECSGGTWREGGALWHCVTCVADEAQWAEPRARGAAVVTTELVLCAVLRQQVDYSRGLLV